jgi:magnesium-transporting ATPase (P-type)
VQLLSLLDMGATLATAWRIYRKKFGLIAAVVATVWMPAELLSSYMDYFVFDPDDLRKSFKFAQFLENFFGIIATAGVIFIGSCTLENAPCGYGTAMLRGIRSWPRLWWTRLVSGLLIVVSLLLLILPGIYVAVRLIFIENIAVLQQEYGVAAIKRCFTLTRGRFWETLGFACVLLGILIAGSVILLLPTFFLEFLDVWWIDAGFMVLTDLLAAYYALGLFVRFRELSQAQTANTQAPS